MHASREEMQQLQRAIEPLTRALAARLAQRRKRKQPRARSTSARPSATRCRTAACRPSRSSRTRKPSKPEIMVVADISGSVASFARFTLQFVYAIAGQFSKVRSWVFIDGIDEVTRFFDESERAHRGGAPGEHRGRRRVGRRPLRLRARVRGLPRPAPRARSRRRRRSSCSATRATTTTRPRHWVLKELRQRARRALLAEPRAAWLLGHRRLDRLGVRRALRRRLRVPQPAPAPALRRRRHRSLTSDPGVSPSAAACLGWAGGAKRVDRSQ